MIKEEIVNDWFAICGTGLTYLGEFDCYENADEFAIAKYGEVIWLIDGNEASDWKEVLTNRIAKPMLFRS